MSLELEKEIQKLKENNKVILLAHNYQSPSVQRVADFLGDSLQLSQRATELEDTEIILFAGVSFMAETAALLNPEKKVLFPVPNAHCPMADFLSAKDIDRARKQYPSSSVVLYVNSTAEAKSRADVCCTSANAVQVVQQLDDEIILFGPDRNLAWYVQQHIPEKKIIPIPRNGHCYVHTQFTRRDIEKARFDFPEAEILVHPECNPKVQQKADKIFSTGGMLRYARNSSGKTLVLGTEIGMVDRLQVACPDNEYHPLKLSAICLQQKEITLYDLYNALRRHVRPCGHGPYVVEIPSEIAAPARKSVLRMLELTDSASSLPSPHLNGVGADA